MQDGAECGNIADIEFMGGGLWLGWGFDKKEML